MTSGWPRCIWAGTVSGMAGPRAGQARSAPAYIRASLRQSRVNARLVHRLAPDAPRTRLARALFFAQVSAHPTRVP